MTSEAASPAALDDATLIERVARGDRSAFELLMRRYNLRLYRLARASLGDEAEAKDALQDAYLCAYRSIGTFRGDSTLATWLSRLVLNACGAQRRRSARRENIVPIVSADCDMEIVAGIADSREPPDHTVARAQIRSVLERKVSELPEIFRVVFVLRSVEELSVEEIAATLSLSPETVRSRHFRAKGLLRESLAKEIDLAEGGIYEFRGAHCDAIVIRVFAALDRAAAASPGSG
ncbi:MAG TPA: RNA polymerase sigma factor [Steroidobacteraceae bacterium]|nr:RNA polymerase sigma factor [Steroidobacteraceae bacterium]